MSNVYIVHIDLHGWIFSVAYQLDIDFYPSCFSDVVIMTDINLSSILTKPTSELILAEIVIRPGNNPNRFLQRKYRFYPFGTNIKLVFFPNLKEFYSKKPEIFLHLCVVTYVSLYCPKVP